MFQYQEAGTDLIRLILTSCSYEVLWFDTLKNAFLASIYYLILIHCYLIFHFFLCPQIFYIPGSPFQPSFYYPVCIAVKSSLSVIIHVHEYDKV